MEGTDVLEHSQLQTQQQPTALDLAQSFAGLARELHRLQTKDAAHEAIVQAALRTVPGAQHAGLTMLRGDRFRTIAPSSELPERVDAIQYELRSGPCVDAVLEQTRFRTGDLEHDERWPTFGKRAALEVGVRSMLAFRLFPDDEARSDPVAALNLYSTELDAFSEQCELIGCIFTTHAALALSSADRAEQVTNLRLAQESNREIGTALGVLMSSHRLTQSQAFDLLRMASQHTHRKLRDIAADVVHTGALDLLD
jgi:hypothetical protein